MTPEEDLDPVFVSARVTRGEDGQWWLHAEIADTLEPLGEPIPFTREEDAVAAMREFLAEGMPVDLAVDT